MKKHSALFLVLCLTLGLCVSCGQATSAPSAAPSGEAPVVETDSAGTTLKVALTNPFSGTSAINISNPYRYATFSQVYETLIAYEDGKYVGILAKEWKKLDDYTWQVTLFDDIKDSQGNPFTSSDVAWSFDGQKTAGHVLRIYYEFGAVEVVDDTTFKLTLNTDSDGAFYLLGVQMLLCTQKASDDSPDQLATMPVGTGPYLCTKYVEGSSCTLTKRSDYWKKENLPKASLANVDTIEISYVPEAVQMLGTIVSGNVQVAGEVDMSISKDVDSAPNVLTKYISNGTYNGLAFNMKGRAVSDNKALREAISYAIDPQGLIDAVYTGHATIMDTYGMATASDYNPAWVSGISYDPEKAKEKLTEAGYPDGITITLVSNNVGEDAQLSELIQGYLGAAGINCVLDYVDPASGAARLAEGEWDITHSGGIGVLDMSLFWGNIYNKSETDMSMYFHNDPALYEIYDAYKLAGGKTAENLQKLYEYEYDNVTWLPLFNKHVFFALSGGYKDIYLNDCYMSLPYLGSVTR
ncbi:MAG: ABC transporter substrate-binding protein [Clostridiales bacterium]|jgi:peptide/nickel transport system substrate-binding protein|nr:ABC transporter substrate-binding protein [Clostridiales bacterium]